MVARPQFESCRPLVGGPLRNAVWTRASTPRDGAGNRTDMGSGPLVPVLASIACWDCPGPHGKYAFHGNARRGTISLPAADRMRPLFWCPSRLEFGPLDCGAPRTQ